MCKRKTRTLTPITTRRRGRRLAAPVGVVVATATATAPAAGRIRTHADVLVLVLFRLFPLVAQLIVVLDEVDQFAHFVPHIDALILEVLVDERVVLERSQIVDVLA